MKKSWLIVCLINFCIAAIMGILMRLNYLIPMEFNYGFMLHAHSHTVILGWCYLAVYGFLLSNFLSKDELEKPVYNRLFWVTEISVIGMMASFPFQGYALFSIFFSTLHILCSYYFCHLLLKNHRKITLIEGKMLKTALFFMVFSTLGVWCLGPVASSGAKDSAFYNLAIQFFLHFQFNGWFLFAVLGLFFSKIQKMGIILSQKMFKPFYWTFLGSIFLTYGLPLSWYFSSTIAQISNSFGLILQLISLFFLAKLLSPHLKKIRQNLSHITSILYGFAFSCLVLKILIQSATFLPEIALASHTIRNFTIGFIHLIMLGIVNTFLFAFITEISYFKSNYKFGNYSILLFLSGFVIMEFLLFHQGFCAYIGQKSVINYPLNLFLSSILLLIGLLFLLTIIFKSKKTAL